MMLRILTTGGSVSPGDLQQVAALGQTHGLTTLEISNRQELLLTTDQPVQRQEIARHLQALGMATDEPDTRAQNLVSSLPAADVYPGTPWLTVGVYLDLFAQFTHSPQLKIAIVDPVQSLVAAVAGNINFVAAPEADYWYVLLRPSGSVRRYVWPVLIASESAGLFAQVVETNYLTGTSRNADDFYKIVMAQFTGKTRKLTTELSLPHAGIPMYEGFHPMPSGNYWLGLYRRHQTFPLAFIDALGDLCRQTRIGKVYLTTRKTLLIKDIREADRPAWDRLLGRFGIRTNLPAWHLNWQLPDADTASVALKHQVLHQLEETDVRTDELSFAVNIPFSEASASVVIQQNRDVGPRDVGPRDVGPRTVGTASPQSFDIYQRTVQTTTNAQYVAVAKSRPLAQVSEVVQQLALAYYERLTFPALLPVYVDDQSPVKPNRLIHECPYCLSQYDAHYGESYRGIAAQTAFDALPTTYACHVCEAEKTDFVAKWVE